MWPWTTFQPPWNLFCKGKKNNEQLQLTCLRDGLISKPCPFYVTWDTGRRMMMKTMMVLKLGVSKYS